MKIKDKTIKFISSLLIILVLMPAILFSQPKKAEAIPVITAISDALKAVSTVFDVLNTSSNISDTAISVKNVAKEIARQVLMSIARRALAEITKSTVNWINTGNWGSPLFLENPDSFFKDIAKFEVKTMVDMFGYNSLKYPFGKDFALNTINSYKNQLENNMQYSLSTVMSDEVLLKSYQNDFNVGGWNGFLINTQYPQNNYIGFQMLATEELARRVQDINQTNAGKVQTALQQGQGFLSPQTCLDEGTKYNTIGNQFQKPSFNEAEYRRIHPYDPPPKGTDPSLIDEYNAMYNELLAQAKAGWAKDNTCKNLVNTTPGSIVANQAMNALSSTFRTTELGAAMGNSLSTIFDALLNKLIGSGLNALASTINPEPPRDDWSYDGQTLGSGAYGNNNPWDVGPDEPIILKEFKILLDGKTIKKTPEGATIEEIGNTGNGEYIPGAIANTERELVLISNEDPANPGVMQLLSLIWPQSRELDICIPGPDLGWKARVDKETQRNSQKLQEQAGKDDPEKAYNAAFTLKELEFAVGFFKDWINNKMMLELPSSILFMDAVDEVNTLSQQSDETTKNKRIKSQALARLKAIKTALADITTQPLVGSAQEKVLVSLMKQYKATSNDIATTVSIGNAENALSVAKENLAKLKKLVTQCTAERKVSGWTTPGGWKSSFSGRPEPPCTENASIAIASPLPATMTPGQEYFFTLKTTNVGETVWYDGSYFELVKKSGDFDFAGSGWLPHAVSANSPAAPATLPPPPVPSYKFMNNKFSIIAPSEPGNYSFSLQMNRKSGGSNKKLSSDQTTTTECSNQPTLGWFGNVVTISVSVVGNQVRNTSPAPTPTPVIPPSSLPASPAGKEKELFCDLPVKGGYDHEMFRHKAGGSFFKLPPIFAIPPIPGKPQTPKGSVTHPDIPLVNAKDVMNWPRFYGIFGVKRVNIEMSCNIIYKATILDYKGNLPGLTTFIEDYEEMPEEFPPEDGDIPPPADADTKHGDHAAEVATAKQALVTSGEWTWTAPPSETDTENLKKYECDRFKITNNAAKLIPGAGILEKTGGTNCQGYSVDIIIFDDGYIYDVMNGTVPDGAGPTWGATGCAGETGDPAGTCPKRFKPPI